MGDAAEAAFLAEFPKAHRTGLDRPSFSMKSMPSNLRNLPDFLLPTGFHEVMGFSSRGKNPTLKLKLEKADALKAWAFLGDVFLFVWDSSGKQWWHAPIEDWLLACYHHADVEVFPDNNAPYWNLPWEFFPGTPTPASTCSAAA